MAADWIESYAQWSMKRSPLSPKHFHENIALSLGAGAIAGRVCVRLPHGTIYPNLYILILASSTVHGKSTSFNWANEVVKLTMLDKVITTVPTPEAMIESLSGKEPKNFDDLEEEEQEEWTAGAKWQGRRLFMLDEAGRIFNTLKRDYNSELGDLFMKLYDPQGGTISRTTRGRGHEAIKRYALSCLFATTPRGIRDTLAGFDLWGSGFWVRWNFVSQEELVPWKDASYGEPPSNVIEPLKKLSSVWLEAYNDTPKILAPESSLLKRLNENTRSIREQSDATPDERMKIVLGRLPTAHLKAAMIYALFETEGKVQTLQLRHWDRVQGFVEGWRRDAELSIEMASQSERMATEDRMYELIFGASPAPTCRELSKALHCSAEEVQRMLDTFIKGGVITSGKRGKAVTYLPNIDKEGIKKS